MTNEEATEVVTLLRASTGGRVDEMTLDYFSAALLPLDYDIALSTATTGSTIWRFFPSWAEFKEIYKTQKRLAEPVGEQRTELPPVAREKYGEAAPEWVHVWQWSRTMRSPRCLIPFPQQNQPESEVVSLSMEEYEDLREEWIAAGSPKGDPILGLTRMQNV